MSVRKLAAAAAPDPSVVLAKAVGRAAAYLALSQQELASIVGASPATVSRFVRGARGLAPDSKEGELALLVVRVMRSLDALVGGDESKARAWLASENVAIGGRPKDRMRTVEGLVDVAVYLDAMRGKL